MCASHIRERLARSVAGVRRVLDGVFEPESASDGQVKFREAVELSPQAIAAVQALEAAAGNAL